MFAARFPLTTVLNYHLLLPDLKLPRKGSRPCRDRKEYHGSCRLFPLAPAPLGLRIAGRRRGTNLLLQYRSFEISGQRRPELRHRLGQ